MTDQYPPHRLNEAYDGPRQAEPHYTKIRAFQPREPEPKSGLHTQFEAARSTDAPAVEIASGIDILNASFPEPRWAIQDFLPEGASVMAARPKTGKSWLALNLALAIGHGGTALGRLPCQQGQVLYITLEDHFPRIQRRLKQILKAQQWTMPAGVHFAIKWPRPSRGGIDEIVAWLDRHPAARLVIIDTWARFRDPGSIRANVYEEDYAALAQIQQIALQYSTAILTIHHSPKPKGSADADPLDEVMGTTGNSAPADAVLVLRRARMSIEATLFLTGRDIEERTYRMKVGKAHCLWTIESEDSDDPYADCPPEQKKVLQALRHSRPLSPAELAPIIGKDANTTNQLLARMHRQGTLLKPQRGLYSVPEQSASDASERQNPEPDTSDVSDALRTPFDP